MSTAAHPFKVEYINPFIESLGMLFRSHLGSKLDVGSPGVNRDGTPKYEVSGVIAFCGTVEGRAVVSFSKDVAMKISSNYLGMDDLPEEVLTDSVGEIANVIAGRAKSLMEEHQIVISPPTIITGKFEIADQQGAMVISLPCSTDFGDLQVDISMRSPSPKPRASENEE